MKGNRIVAAWYAAMSKLLREHCATSQSPCSITADTLREPLPAAFKSSAAEPVAYCFDELNTAKLDSKVFGLTPGCHGCLHTPVSELHSVYSKTAKALERYAYVLSESSAFYRDEEDWNRFHRLDLDTLLQGDSARAELFRRLVRGEFQMMPRFSNCPGAKPVYPPLPRQGERKLTLIHIPRPGGTTIAACSKDEADDDDRWSARNTKYHFQVVLPNGGGRCWGQHIPATVEPMQALFQPSVDSDDTFCVVRDPFARLVSEYGFYQSWTKPENRKCGAEWMNMRMVEWMNKYLGLNGTKAGPYSRDCHMLPQAAYVYGWDPNEKKVLRNVKSCKNIIRFEKLHADFNSLMEARGYPYRMTAKKSMPSTECTTTLRRGDFSPEAKKLVYEVYKDDFELLGYPID
jgi:hypothetical protein